MKQDNKPGQKTYIKKNIMFVTLICLADVIWIRFQ